MTPDAILLTLAAFVGVAALVSLTCFGNRPETCDVCERQCYRLYRYRGVLQCGPCLAEAAEAMGEVEYQAVVRELKSHIAAMSDDAVIELPSVERSEGE